MPNNRGRTHSFLFFLKWGYWFGKSKKEVESLPMAEKRRRLSSVEKYDVKTDTASDEKNQILEDERLNIQ